MKREARHSFFCVPAVSWSKNKDGEKRGFFFHETHSLDSPDDYDDADDDTGLLSPQVLNGMRNKNEGRYQIHLPMIRFLESCPSKREREKERVRVFHFDAYSSKGVKESDIYTTRSAKKKQAELLLV